MGKLKIELIRSEIGQKQGARNTVRALGLKRLHHEVTHDDTPVIRGMIYKIQHMLRVEEVQE